MNLFRKSLPDIDECSLKTHNCHPAANCRNSWGSYECECKTGYKGDGYSCGGKSNYIIKLGENGETHGSIRGSDKTFREPKEKEIFLDTFCRKLFLVHLMRAQCRQQLEIAATILRSWEAKALSRGDGSYHSLHTSA